MALDRRTFLKTAGVASTAAALPAALPAGTAAALPGAAAAAHEPRPGGPGSIRLTDLLVEKKSSPLGIDVDRPRFSWTIETDRRGVEQESYRLRVSTRGPRSRTVWDSGVVRSRESANVGYAGPPLGAATEHTWRVDVGTTHGSASATAAFRTGLYAESDWAGAAWIGNERVPAEVTDLRFDDAAWMWAAEGELPGQDRAFRITRPAPDGARATRAEVLITADDAFTLWVDGVEAGGTEPAENGWQAARFYAVDLSAGSPGTPGAATVLAVRGTNDAVSAGAVLAVVRLTYSDGTTATLTSGSGWKAATAFEDDFARPGLDDSAWAQAAQVATYGSGPWGRGVRLPTPDPLPAPLLRTELDVRAGLRSATLYLAAGGYADVSLNGEPADDQVLAPGFTDYDDTVQYTATDLTRRLRRGRNALGIELGRGFYGMTGGNVWRWEAPPWHDEPVVRAVLRLEYAGGAVEHVVTDATWRVHDGPTVFDDLYGGEAYDARRTLPGWDTAGFDDAGWAAATVAPGPRGVLVNQRQQPIKVIESLPAVEVTEPAPGVYVVRFPRVLAGWVRYTATGPAGATIRAAHGEKLTAAGRVNLSNNGGFQAGFQTDRFTLAGTGQPETWEPRFSYKGFQYIEVTGWPQDGPPPLDAFTAQVVHTAAAETGTFDSSSEIMNRTHRAVVDTLTNNIHGIPTDTPMFEKNGWTGDAAIGAEMFLLNLDVHELFAKWLRDVHETRDEQGRPLVIAPSSGDWGEWGVCPPWHAAYVMIPWWLYQYGGDTRVLTECYDGMKRYVDLELDRSQGGIVPDARLGDWVSPEASPAGGNAPEDLRVSATAFLYSMTLFMRRGAGFLGKAADVEHFARNAATIKAAFNETFLDADAEHYRGDGDRGYRQTHNVLAVEFGLVPDAATTQRVVSSIVADVRAKGTKLNTGVLGTKWLLPVLTRHGHADLAYELAVQTGYPSWGYMIESGATSMWEHWSREARSYGHYFLGTVDDWFYQHVAGIQASPETGFRDITIAPAVTGHLDRASASVRTPFGTVTSDWRRAGGRLRLNVTVPVGSAATVRLPVGDPEAVTEQGRPLRRAEGVTGVAVEDDAVVVRVGSGRYSFVA
ncbi:family 78 glycoside hydrolase catalytic domain [Promicromonospora sp. NPDC090134]|uniref:family 78 glycoside hydrolase catalytic domain n=1 Tax=Promicromonospora sp. NPDC090134 TaxID=3364408 RepID=UPI003817B3D8